MSGRHGSSCDNFVVEVDFNSKYCFCQIMSCCSNKLPKVMISVVLGHDTLYGPLANFKQFWYSRTFSKKNREFVS